MKNKVIVLGPGRKTRGGITSVIKAHEQSEVWEKWNCKWLETYIDRGSIAKTYYFLKGYFHFLLNIRSANIVHIHFSEPMSAFRKSIFFKTAKLFRKIVVLHFHAFSPESTIFGKHKKMYAKMFNGADAIIALSSFWKEQISNIIVEKSQINVIYNPCPSISELPDYNKQNAILFAGTLNSRKGYSDLLRAFANIAKQFPEWKVAFAGNGEIEKAKNLTCDLGIENQVVFEGWISGDEKDRLFKSSSIFCLPSYAEGFPMAVLDAWAYGLPIITTPVGGLPDVLINGENALVFNPGDIVSLLVHLESLITNEQLRTKLSEASFNLSKNEFSIKRISVQLDNLYSGLLNKSH